MKTFPYEISGREEGEMEKLRTVSKEVNQWDLIKREEKTLISAILLFHDLMVEKWCHS